MRNDTAAAITGTSHMPQLDLIPPSPTFLTFYVDHGVAGAIGSV
jgi:hypothetical protein